jgi:hypothetical protein
MAEEIYVEKSMAEGMFDFFDLLFFMLLCFSFGCFRKGRRGKIDGEPWFSVFNAASFLF